MITSRLLTDEQRQILADERALLSDLRASLASLGAGAEADAALARSIRQLDELFLLVVVGEFNAGKSALVNALLDAEILPEGVTPTTAQITVVRFGDQAASGVDEEGVMHVTAPVDILRELHLVDTPGTNAVLREHEAVTRRFVPRADLILFVTSADRPFAESERAFLERIHDWGKKVVIVVNKTDILAGPPDVEEVLAFVRHNAAVLLAVEPPVFPASARLGRNRRGSDPVAWEASGLRAIDEFLWTTLDASERVRLKLLNPLGVGESLARDVRHDVDGRKAILADDETCLADVERQLGAYATDMRRDFEFRWADIDKLLVEMERRGHDHFDDTLRLARVTHLLDRPRMRREFEERVVGDTPQRVERKVRELVDWLVDAEFRQWQAVNGQLTERRIAHRDGLPASTLQQGFHSERERLVDSVGRNAQEVVDTFDHAGAGRELAEKARNAVTASAAIEVGAAGLGAAVAAVATSAAADVTGLAMAGVLATLGLLVIPNRRRQAKRELRERLSDVRRRLDGSLRQAFEEELAQSVGRIRGSLEPYSRFVRSELGRLSGAQAELQQLEGRLGDLRARIEAR